MNILRDICGILTSVNRRSALLLLVAASIVVNVSTGAFARVVYAHEHGHTHESSISETEPDHSGDHHRHDPDHDAKPSVAAINPDDDQLPTALQPGAHDAMHEHEVVTALLAVLHDDQSTVFSSSVTFLPRSPAPWVEPSGVFERPPRAV